MAYQDTTVCFADESHSSWVAEVRSAVRNSRNGDSFIDQFLVVVDDHTSLGDAQTAGFKERLAGGFRARRLRGGEVGRGRGA